LCVCPTDDETGNAVDTEVNSPTTLDVINNENGEIIKPNIFSIGVGGKLIVFTARQHSLLCRALY